MAATMNFSGGRELNRALLELSTKSAQKVGRFALRRAANNILRAARANAPKGQPRLSKAIKLRIDRLRTDKAVLGALVYVAASAFDYRPRKSQRASTVKGKKGPARYGYQIGTRPDVYGRFLEWGAPGRNIAAQPWFRPAWHEQGGETALRVLAEEMGNGLMAEAARLKGL